MTDGSTRHFDSPLCALKAWREGHVDARSMRVIDYYDGRWRDARELLFVAGSDVSGPMGPDLVPVDAARAQKFSEDHAAARPLPLAAITPEIVSQIR
jgi:copper chaperone NosL